MKKFLVTAIFVVAASGANAGTFTAWWGNAVGNVKGFFSVDTIFVPAAVRG